MSQEIALKISEHYPSYVKKIGLENLNRKRLPLLHQAGPRLFEVSKRLYLPCTSCLLGKLLFSSIASLTLSLVGVKYSLLPKWRTEPQNKETICDRDFRRKRSRRRSLCCGKHKYVVQVHVGSFSDG